eukprot:12545397-Alexandrium_andersonii.AAC.1
MHACVCAYGPDQTEPDRIASWRSAVPRHAAPHRAALSCSCLDILSCLRACIRSRLRAYTLAGFHAC